MPEGMLRQLRWWLAEPASFLPLIFIGVVAYATRSGRRRCSGQPLPVDARLWDRLAESMYAFA